MGRQTNEGDPGLKRPGIPDLNRERRQQLVAEVYQSGLIGIIPGETSQSKNNRRDVLVQTLMRDRRITKADLARFLGDRLVAQVEQIEDLTTQR